MMQSPLRRNYECARELLEKAGIYRFAAEISKLAEICFSDKPKDEFSDTILSYIFSGGMYGTFQNKMTVMKSKDKSTVKYLLQRLFMPYKSMVILYPILNKLPILLPFCWVARFFKMLFGGNSKRALGEIKVANTVTDDQISVIVQLREHLGL